MATSDPTAPGEALSSVHVGAARAIRRALALLSAASADSRFKGPSDGTTPLHWPIAARAARAQLMHALARLEQADDGIAWWNSATREERRHWREVAGSAVPPADAWRAFRSASADRRARDAQECRWDAIADTEHA